MHIKARFCGLAFSSCRKIPPCRGAKKKKPPLQGETCPLLLDTKKSIAQAINVFLGII
jgi:hypothetical protein